MVARNFGVLVGYYTGLAARERTTVEAFKKEAGESPVFAIALPVLCQQIGITPPDVTLVCNGLSTGLIPVHSMACWGYGDVLAKLDPAAVTPLFDQLFTMDGEAYSVALDIMGMYADNKAHRLDALRPQLRTAVANVHKRLKGRGSQMDAYHFEQIIAWLLKKGRNDADGRAVAGALAKYLADHPDAGARNFIMPLLPIILSDFGPIVWPPFGQAIVGDPA